MSAYDDIVAKFGGSPSATPAGGAKTTPSSIGAPTAPSGNDAYAKLVSQFGGGKSAAADTALPDEKIQAAPAPTFGGTLGRAIGGAAKTVVDTVKGTASRLAGAVQETVDGAPAPAAPAAPAPNFNFPNASADPLQTSIHASLNTAFPGETSVTTPSTTKTGTVDALKATTAALIAVPKAIVNNQINPNDREKDLEAKAFPTTGNAVEDAVQAPERILGKAVYRFFTPGFEPVADDITTVALGNGGFGYDPKNNDILPSISKHGPQVVGDVSQAVLQAYMPSLFGKTAAGAASLGARQALLTGARDGATTGLTFGVAQALSSGSKDPKEIGKILFQNTVGGAILGGITSGAIPVAREGVAALTKEVTDAYSMPKSVFIDGSKVRSIFQTGEEISPEETQMIKELGLTGSEYRDAIKNGVNIEVPIQHIITSADRPWFAKLKEAIGLQPSAPDVKIISAGKTERGAETRADRLLPGEGESSVPNVTGTALEAGRGASEPVAPSGGAPAALPAPKAVSPIVLADTPIDSHFKTLVENSTPQESAAFGRAVVKDVVSQIGDGSAVDKNSQLPPNVKISEQPSSDGRPAQYNADGTITLFTQNLAKDLDTLASGGRIMAHGNSPYAQVFTMKPGETPSQLATRYVKEVLAHEVGHLRTMTAEDIQKTEELRKAVVDARVSKNEKAITAAKTVLEEHMRGLEDKANQHVSENRAALHKELFPQAEKVAAAKVAAQRVGARVGFQEGKKVGAAIEKNKADVREQKIKDKADADKLKQRIQDRTRSAKEIANTKSRYETAIDAVKSRSETLEGKRKALIDYAELVPANVRGKFLRAIENAHSGKEFNEVIDRMNKEANVQERKGLIERIRKEIKQTVVKKANKIPNAKFAYEQQKDLNRIRAGLDLSYPEAQVTIANKIADWQTQHPDEVLPNDLLHEVQILNMRGIKDMDASQLRRTLADIQSIKETGRTLKEVQKFNRDTEIGQARDAIREVLVSGKTLPSAEKFVPEKEDAGSAWQRAFKGIVTFHTEEMGALEETLDRLSKFDKTSKQYSSFLSRYVSRNVNSAFKTEYQGQAKYVDEFRELIKDTFNVDKPHDVLRVIAERDMQIDVGNFPDASGVLKDLKISRAQATAKWMQYQDPTLHESFHSETGLGWTDDVRDAAFKVMTPEDKVFGEKLLDFYREYYKGVNAVFSSETGVDLPFNENYSPINRDVETLMPESTLLAQEMSKYASAKNGSLKERVKTTIPLRFDGDIETFMRHLTKMEHYKAWNDPMNKLRSIFGNKDVRRAIVELHSKSQMKILDDYLNDFARGGIANEKVIRWADQLRGNITRSLIGFNPVTGFKRLVSIMNYGGEMPLKDFFTGVTNFWSDPMGKSKFLYENSAVLQERFGVGYERDIKAALDTGYDKKLAATRTFTKNLFFLVRGADKLTIYHGAWAAYRSRFNELAREGKLSNTEAQKEAIEYAEALTMRVDETSRMDTLAPLQRKGSLMRLFTMFMSQPNKYYRLITNAARNYRYGRGSKADQVKRILWYWFVTPMIFNLMTNAFTKQQYQKSAGGLFAETALGPLTYPFITGEIAKNIVGHAFFHEPFAYTASPAESIVANLLNATDQFTKGNAITATTYAGDALGESVGVPATLIDRPIRAADKATRQ